MSQQLFLFLAPSLAASQPCAVTLIIIIIIIISHEKPSAGRVGESVRRRDTACHQYLFLLLLPLPPRLSLALFVLLLLLLRLVAMCV